MVPARLDSVGYAEKMYRLANKQRQMADEIENLMVGSWVDRDTEVRALTKYAHRRGQATAYLSVAKALHKFNVEHGLVTEAERYNGTRKEF